MTIRPPRARFHLRTLLIAVAVAGLALAVVSLAYREGANEQARAAIVTGSVVGGAVGLWSMRQPFIVLAVLLGIGVVVPAVDHPPLAVRGIAAGCLLGWIIGAPSGWLRTYLATFHTPESPPRSDDQP